MAWGCAPSKIVLLETKMIRDFFQTLKDRYNRKTLAVTFPDCIDDLVANTNDEQWEVYKTNKIKKCSIFRSSNKVIKSIGHIFVQSKIKSVYDISKLPEGQERVEKLKELFVPLWMKNKNKTEAEANADFEALDPKMRAWQDNTLLNDAEWPNYKERGEFAKEFLKQLGFKEEDVHIHTDLTKSEID